MEFDRKLLQKVKNLMMARYPRFGSEIASVNLEYKTDLKYHTAATDGKNIYFDPNYLASLSDDDKLFLIAHELMHIKFEHMFRITGRDGKMRDLSLWNQATDAIINANLERDGFKIKEGYVNMPGALNYSAEELYDKLLSEKKAKEQQPQGNNGQGQSGQGGQEQDSQQDGQEQDGQQGEQGKDGKQENQGQKGQQGEQDSSQNEQDNGSQSESGQNNNQPQQNKQGDGKSSMPNFWKGHNGDQQGAQSQEQGQSNNSNQSGQSSGQHEQSQESQSSESQEGQSDSVQDGMMDDHSLWEEAFKQRLQGDTEEETSKDENKQSQSQKLSPDAKIPEFEEAKFNEKTQFQENREERRAQARRNMEKMRNNEMAKNDGAKIEFGEVGQAKPILDWKLLLRREVEKTETIWSQRRSIAENNYAYRLEENDVEDEAETEVMIDVSGSVSLEMVKAFLRQLKPLLRESKLKVGCFNERFWGMVEIKSERDIDNFKIPAEARGDARWTEDWDLAVRSFSKKREVNKIVFTDGIPCPGTMPKSDLKGVNVLWLVYRNRNFHPCCGKVIDIYEKDLQSMVNAEQDYDDLEPSL